MHVNGQPCRTIWFDAAQDCVKVIDQTRLPHHFEIAALRTLDDACHAIVSMQIRGAPLIGVTAAFGVALALREGADELDAVCARLLNTRPTAVNLRWAVERVVSVLAGLPENTSAQALAAAALAEARSIHEEDRRLCAAIGRHGAAILPEGGVLTHCNTGALATGGDGTALAVITTAWAHGRRFDVFADETRPLFPGARLTAWELVERGIPVTVLVDSAAAQLLRTGRVGACIVGADRITANGDTANKIGTYGLAVLAEAHGVPFFVAAPSSTFDLSLETGVDIPIEERAAAEVLRPLGVPAAPEHARAYNPAFDVTPARLITGIITEHGVIQPVTRDNVLKMVPATKSRSAR